MKKTVWICRDRQGEKIFAERPRWHNGHDILTGKQVDFGLVARKRKYFRVITKFTVDCEGPFLGPKKMIYEHKRAGAAPL